MQQEMMPVVYILAGLLGLCIGSFLNVVIYRLPNGMSLAHPSSHCPNCNYALKWYDNIPVLSYLILGGKCRKCRKPISPRYVAVELTTCALYLLSVFLFWDQSIPYAVTTALAASVLVCVFFIDLEHLYIPDRFQIILAVLGFVCVFFDPGTVRLDHLIGCLAGGGVFLAVALISKKILGREGLGMGDVKLAFCTGLLLGWQKFLLAILLASLCACAVMIPRRYLKKEKQKEFPFAPFISTGVLTAIYAGTFIIDWYVKLLIG